MIWLVTIVLVVIAVDAIRSRIKLELRARATARTVRRSHELSNGRGGEGWHPLEDIEADERGGEQNPFERILGRDRR
jgi:hypothetical protein